LKQELAVIDIGSNSIRYVIFHPIASGRYIEKINIKVVARLSAHINKDGALDDAGISLLEETLHRFYEVGVTHEVEETICVATAAIRNATNREAIVKSVTENTPFSIQVLTDEQEAYYGYFAIINSTFLTDGFSVDIGGGSMEVTLIENREMVAYHSFPFGAVTLTRQFVSDETLSASDKKKLVKFLREQFESIPWLSDKKLPLIGVGGSARNFVRIHQSNQDYPLRSVHQYQIKAKELAKMVDDLEGKSAKQLSKIEGLSKDRIDIFLPALIAIQGLAQHIEAEEFIMSNLGLREGLVYEFDVQDEAYLRIENVREQSLYQLESDYKVNRDRASYIGTLAKSMYRQLVTLDLVSERASDLRLLDSASRLFYCGQYINPDTRSDQTFYLLTNTEMNGMTHKDRVALSLVSSYSSAKRMNQLAKPFKDWFTEKSLDRFDLLGSLLKLSHALDVTERKAVDHLELFLQKDQLQFVLDTGDHDYGFEVEKAEKQKKHLERIIDCTITFETKGDLPS